MITSDFHMHTAYSTDSDSPAERMAEEAVRRGLKTICITDHLDKDYPFYEDLGKDAFLFDVEDYISELEALKEAYAGKLEIRIGVEFGMQPHLGEFCRELSRRYPFDFIIGSIHVVNGTDPYYGEIFRQHTDEEAYRETFRATLENLRQIEDFDVLGHLDYIVRYGRQKEKEYSYEKYAVYLDEILKTLIQNGKGIELNTAGLKYGLGFCHPHPDVLRRYRKLGGEIITVGSDAHKPEHIAYHFEQARAVLKECGFRYYTEFKGRIPEFKQLG